MKRIIGKKVKNNTLDGPTCKKKKVKDILLIIKFMNVV